MREKQISEESDDSESEPWYHKPVAQTNEACGEPPAGETAESIYSAFQKSQNNEEATLVLCHIATNNLFYGSRLRHGQEDLRKTTRRSYGGFGRECGHMGIFMNATLKAAVHLGNDHDVNLRHVKNSFWSSAGQLFGETEKVISGQTETTGIRTINSEDLRWISTTLLHSRAYQHANAKVYVFSDSVLFFWKNGTQSC